MTNINEYKTIIFHNIHKHFIMLLLGLLLLFSCNSKDTYKNNIASHKKALSSVLYTIRFNEDSLNIMLQNSIDNQDDIGMMLCYKQLGNFQRENTHFSDAIYTHQKGLNIALKLKDTIEIVQAYNNLGTDFRRIGALNEASTYHYKALTYSETYSKSNIPGSGLKNKVVSLNGLGNICLSLDYYDEAEIYFRQALQGEYILNSHIGQAINLSNLGSIFEHRQQYDSALIYYLNSMEQNKIGKSNLGIALCHIHLGDLLTIEKKYIEAREEYIKAYQLMENISDRWHWLEACISLAKIDLLTNDFNNFIKYINIAEETALKINSHDHLVKIYQLKHEYYLQKGDYLKALNNYKLKTSTLDSLNIIQKDNVYLNMKISYERDKNTRQIAKLEALSKTKNRQKNFMVFVLLMSFIVIGALYYAYRQRNKSNKLLKEIGKTRSLFFTNLAHEIRTPLTVISGLNSRMMKDKNMSEQQLKAFHEAIERQSANLINIVNEMLDVAKLNSNIDIPEWKHGNILPYIQMKTEAFRLYAENQNINLIFYTDLNECYIDFIPFYLDKIITNLLSNAIKHTKDGDRINLILTNGKYSGTIMLRVTDTGEGIPKEDLNRIFEMFYQSPSSNNSAGSGIGLAFVKMMVSKMKGTISVESQEGKGSSFTVILPIKNNKIPNIKPFDEKIINIDKPPQIDSNINNDDEVKDFDDNDSNTKPLILVIEDNKDLSIYIKSLLEEKYQLIMAYNGEEGYKIAESRIPDIVITDIMMPKKDGYQFCKEMKENNMLNNIPVIMLTAKSTDKDRIEGLRSGAEAYLNKPFIAEELLVLINNILNNREMLKKKYMDIIMNNAQNNKNINDENIIFLQKITDIIYSEIQNPDLNAFFIANKIAVSIHQLNRKISSIAGCSTTTYILKIKLNNAKKLLKDTTKNVSEVSYACGFSDSNYFTRTFKKEFGITPTQFQKTLPIQ